MKASLLIVLSLAALAAAGPASNKKNQIETDKQQTGYTGTAGQKDTQAVEILKQWCFSSQMSQPELTASFKKLVGIVKSSPEDQTTEAAVMSERICQGALVQKSAQSGETVAQGQADAQAHELIKDLYMDSLIACESRECTKQLVKIISSNKVDTIRASYYMTRIAVTERDSIKDESQVKQLADSFLSGQAQPTSEAVERQKLFAVTALIAKSLKGPSSQQQGELKQTAEQVAKTIVERYIKPVSQQEVQQYKQQQPEQQSSQVAKKIARRNAALKALANIPSWMISGLNGVEETLVELAQNKDELSTVRQSAIECLSQCESATKTLKQITFDQGEPIEVRVAAYRALISSVYAGSNKSEQNKQQMAAEIVEQVVKHCEDSRNQQQDDQFVLYAISHLDNLRTSQQPEHQAIKECIVKNKQHYMQIQLLCKKFKQQLSDVRKSSRNYKFEQEFNKLESGLILEGDLVYESKHKQQQQVALLPKLIRVNMSMPVMGETVNVVEITVRQNEMDEQLLDALKLVQGAKFNSESMGKVVDSFKSSITETSSPKSTAAGKQQSAEADLSIKIDGCTVFYVCVDDFKSSTGSSVGQRNTRSIYSSDSMLDDIVEYLKRKPVAFNRGFNFNLNQRLAKVLDVDANVIAGLRFESRASGQSSDNFEIVAQIEPRFAFEAIVGPAKISSKKILQRLSTKTALGMRLRFKSDQLVDVQLDLPMDTMELFTFETQMVERNPKSTFDSYTYLPDSIYGQEDIYSPDEIFTTYADKSYKPFARNYQSVRKMKRSIFESRQSFGFKQSMGRFMRGKESTYAKYLEVPEEVARATGLGGKLRLVGSPKETSFLAQAIVQKYEPSMEGYRVKIEKVERGEQGGQQYTMSLSTPGSRVQRSMQARLSKQLSKQRSSFKCEIESPQMSAIAHYELIHDGRQYAVKALVSSSRGQHWRHAFECGLHRGGSAASSQAGTRLTSQTATTYKPYLTIESSALKRPLQMQGYLTYQETPKTVISFEFKCPSSSEFVQGKLIVDERRVSSAASGTFNKRRSMQSPLELILQNDYTINADLVGQVGNQAAKMHQMVDWEASKLSLNSEMTISHKNIRKPASQSQVSASLKLEAEQQVLVVQRKSPQEEEKEFRFTLNSLTKLNSGHQMSAEYRYNAIRGAQRGGLNSVLAYKHQIEFVGPVSPSNFECNYSVEFIGSEYQIAQKFTGRTKVDAERKLKTLITEFTNGSGSSGKLNVEFVSLSEHQIELSAQSKRYNHKCSVRANERQFNVQSRTEKEGQLVAKFVIEIEKQACEGRFLFELPSKQCHLAADLKLKSGKLSSIAVQTPRFSSKAEFALEPTTAGRYYKPAPSSWFSSPLLTATNFRFKGDLRDSARQEAYWLESAFKGFGSNKDKSYINFDSPLYRSDMEYEPSEQRAAFGVFERSKRAANYNQLYSILDDQSLGADKLNLANKMWQMRAIVSSPRKAQQMARNALFEYADRRQSQRHSFDYNPTEDRLTFELERKPNTDFGPSTGAMRMTGDLATKLAGSPMSKVNMESEMLDLELAGKPYDGEEAFARVRAVSRYPRSAFKKHESELSYKRQAGYKAYMKHHDHKNRHHSLELEADQSPARYAKVSYKGDRQARAEWEHQWRKHSHSSNAKQQAASNKASWMAVSPSGDFEHSSSLMWQEEPMVGAHRIRRDLYSSQSRYNLLDYLKHTNARFNSQTSRNQAPIYKLDFDYQPEQSRAKMNVGFADDLLHSSSIEFEPSERVYKLHSQLVDRRTSLPSYQLSAVTGPFGLASAEQEPVFVDEHHPMLERAMSKQPLVGLFKQPIKINYNDMYGRLATFDYDHSPVADNKYAGLRQKRAALYYKDSANDFEHSSSYDFYPEAVFGLKPSKRVPGDFSVSAQTKYGPIALIASSAANSIQMKLDSPVVGARLVSELANSRNGAKVIKFSLDNKQQKVQLAKLVRKSPMLADCHIARRVAAYIDESRIEHFTEMLLASQMEELVVKVKSETMVNERPLVVLEAELDEPKRRAFAKIGGERVDGELVVDLATKTARLVMDVDGKRTIEHESRASKIGGQLYAVESLTSYMGRPLYKLSGKVSSMILSEPEHLFARVGRGSGAFTGGEHVSSIEVIVYEPKPVQISAKYDCLKKEAHVLYKDLSSDKIQESYIKYDDQTESIIIDARLSSPEGQIYTSQARLNLPGFLGQIHKCPTSASCASELIYSDKSNNRFYSTKYIPGEYIQFNSPSGRQTVNLLH